MLGGEVTTAAVGWAVVTDAAGCDVVLEGSNSRRAAAANAHAAGVAAGVAGEPPTPVFGTLAAAAVMRGTRDGRTVAVGGAARFADFDAVPDADEEDGRDDGRCARLWDAEADDLCADEPESPEASAQATAVPEAMAAPTPKATASAPNRPTCTAALIEGLIRSTPVGSRRHPLYRKLFGRRFGLLRTIADLDGTQSGASCVTLVTNVVANIGAIMG